MIFDRLKKWYEISRIKLGQDKSRVLQVKGNNELHKLKMRDN